MTELLARPARRLSRRSAGLAWGHGADVRRGYLGVRPWRRPLPGRPPPGVRDRRHQAERGLPARLPRPRRAGRGPGRWVRARARDRRGGPVLRRPRRRPGHHRDPGAPGRPDRDPDHRGHQRRWQAGAEARFTLATLPVDGEPYWGGAEPVVLPPIEECDTPQFGLHRGGTISFDPATSFTITPDGPVVTGSGESVPGSLTTTVMPWTRWACSTRRTPCRPPPPGSCSPDGCRRWT